MPQMYPTSWIFVYLFVIFGYSLVFLVIFSHFVSLVGNEDLASVSCAGVFWRW